MIEKTFERLWAENRQRLLDEDEEYTRIRNSYRKHGSTDWIILAVAVVSCMELTKMLGITNEWLSFAIALVMAFIFMAFYWYYRAIKVSRKTLEEVEERIKEEYRKKVGR